MADLGEGEGASRYDEEFDEVEDDEAGWVVKEERCARCGAELRGMGRCRREH
jgi:hypothetical protein